MQRRKAKLEEGLSQELTDSTIDDLLYFSKAVAIGLNNPTPEERWQWLEALQTRVTVSSGIAVVVCRLSREAVSFDLLTEYNASRGSTVN